MSEFNQGSQFSTSPSPNLDDFSKPAKPANNLVLSIVSTVLGICSPCCIGLILGIVAIVFSTQVDSKYNMGDYPAAEDSAKKAKMFALIALGLFAIGIIMSAVRFATGGFDAVIEQYQQVLDQVK